ncbi:hypothetical protein C0Q70_17684 [Pomacea canaliculata]|uniref:Uncharacterized protein n=1 Tax=Pomacea canaliculata TaxID=400727 RepID=A0A2T7NL48_POMCA|nr:hypothetical protein C0Q70_17684 [Pomacea canaliculata]
MRLNVILTCLTLCVLHGAVKTRRHFLFSSANRPSSTRAWGSSALQASELWDAINSTEENPSDVVRYLMVLQPGDGYPSWVQPQAPETPLLGTVFPVPWKRLLPAPKIGFLELLSRHRSLKQVAANSMPEQPMIAAASFRKRDRYNCDLSRVSIQMIIEYLRTRRICGFRVNQMRFALGGK